MTIIISGCVAALIVLLVLVLWTLKAAFHILPILEGISYV